MLWVGLAMAALQVDAMAIDFEKVPRMIAKPPACNSLIPLHGLFLFGEGERSRVWAVLDQSEPGSGIYDILYVDLDGDGDLTELGESFVGEPPDLGQVPPTEEPPIKRTFHVGVVRLPGAERAHTKFTIEWFPAAVSYRVLWHGELLFTGGFGGVASKYSQFSPRPGLAPIFVIDGTRPLGSRLLSADKLERRHHEEISIVLGIPGEGSFSCFHPSNLPEGEYVLGSLLYRDRRERPKTKPFELRVPC
jgi:hypothetical protein